MSTMHRINTLRELLTQQGWDVVATNTRDGRFYHAEHTALHRSFSGLKEKFRKQAHQYLA